MNLLWHKPIISASIKDLEGKKATKEAKNVAIAYLIWAKVERACLNNLRKAITPYKAKWNLNANWN